MSRKCSLDTQTGKICFVIRKNRPISKNLIRDYLNEVALEYAFIEHTRDIEPVTGITEGVHYHIVYKAKDTRQRLGTILNNWCDYLGFKDTNGLQIEKYISYESSLQYLIHKNNPEKTPHKIEEIITNIDTGLLNTYLTTDMNIVSFDYVYSLCNSSSNILEVIKALGLTNYQRYRATIWDIWNEIHKLELTRAYDSRGILKNN